MKPSGGVLEYDDYMPVLENAVVFFYNKERTEKESKNLLTGTRKYIKTFL